MARVLVVEDEPNIAGIIAFKLRREGHDVRCAADLEAAAGSVGWPEVAVLDAAVSGPKGSGPGDLAGSLAERCPLLVLTDAHDAGAGLEVGRMGTATMRKPFKPTVLARAVAELVESGGRGR